MKLPEPLQALQKNLRGRFDGLSLRERLMVIAAVVAVMYGGWDHGVMQPQAERQAKLTQQIQQQLHLIESNQRRISALLESNDVASDDAQDEIDNLRAEIDALDDRLMAATEGLIPARRMAAVLEELLAGESSLRLTALENQAMRPQSAEPPVESEGASDTGENINEPKLFRHGFSLHFEGDYRATVSYLKALEALPWRVYCDRVRFTTAEYPSARITLELYTLSLNEGWIGA